MRKPRFVAKIFSAGLMVLGAGAASGQDYPNRPIRIVTAQPGGGSDLAARLIAHELTGPLGQPVIVENRGTNIASEIVARAAPDGYTLLVAADSLWVGSLMRKTSYDPVRDFSPISLLTIAPTVLVVHPSVPVKSVKELIALAKAKPGELNFSSASPGSASHLAGELFKAMAGINMEHILYKGAGPALIGLIGGEIQLMFASAGSAASHTKAGRLRAVAVTGRQPSALLPGLPTVASTGLPGYEAVANWGAFAPAKTSAAIINRLNQEIVRVLNSADVKEKFLSSGVEAISSSPHEFAAVIKSEMAKWGKVIKDAGIRAD